MSGIASELLDTAPTPTTRDLARAGARDMTPMAVGIVPFGLALGAMIGASGIDPWAALASAPLILAGAAQLTTLQMLETGSNPVVIVASALLINLRILLYSASLAPWFSGVRLRLRLLLATSVIDQTHFVAVPRFEGATWDNASVWRTTRARASGSSVHGSHRRRWPQRSVPNCRRPLVSTWRRRSR
jgi:predicted branched-subunit amino acid permease